MLGHNYIEQNHVAATCEADGFIRFSCSHCNNIKKDMLPKLSGGHYWTETNRIPATCTSGGIANYACAKCDETKNKYLHAPDHVYTEPSSIPAT